MDMLSRDLETLFAAEAPRRLSRAEYARLGRDGYFEDEKVELLFGMVVPMSPIDRAHVESANRIGDKLREQLRGRARVELGSPLAATDDSEPEPDIMVLEAEPGWHEHPSHAYLVVEVSRSSLRKDRGPKALLYSISNVDEYWIVDHVNSCARVYRDRIAGDEPTWASITVHQRGETIAMRSFPDVVVDVAAILPPIE